MSDSNTVSNTQTDLFLKGQYISYQFSRIVIKVHKSLLFLLLQRRWTSLSERVHREQPTHQKIIFQFHSEETQRNLMVSPFQVLSVHRSYMFRTHKHPKDKNIRQKFNIQHLHLNLTANKPLLAFYPLVSSPHFLLKEEYIIYKTSHK